MTSPVFALFLTYLFLGKMGLKSSPTVRQETRFLSVKTGDKLTLQCFYEGDVAARLYWFKQILGQKAKLISTFFKYNVNVTFHNEFKNNPRFTLDMENGKNHLTIKDLRPSDSATYYCINFLYTLDFSESIFVNVKGSDLKIPATVHQSSSESIQPGGSVTLNCTVHTGTCDGEHSVYWFKNSEESQPGLIYTHGDRNDQSSESIQPGGSVTLNCTVHTGTCDGEHSVYWFKNSEESQPGLIYTHGDRNDQCERKPNTQTHTCVYNLPMKSLNISHAGTYYCAVVSCGHVLFGNGTKLHLEDEVDSPFLVYFLSAALAFTTILSVLLAFLMYKVNKRNRCQTADADNLHYAALSVNLPNRSRRQRNNTNDECVYSSVKQ
uniref:Ig-like domain-containing protein n=1 Tax=Sander lucioperca TaxID=283035 RepID=A0A8C9X1A6_SANLU